MTELPDEEFFADTEEAEADWDDHRVPTKPRFVLAAVLGLIASLVTAGLWAAIVGLTGFEIGYLAVGVGGLTGFAVAQGAGAADQVTGGLAVGLAIIGLLTAKILIVALVLPIQLTEEIAKDTKTMGTALYRVEHQKGLIDPEITDWYDNAQEGDVPAPELADRMTLLDAELEQRAARMPIEDRKQIAAPFADDILASSSLEEKLDFSFFDLLWLALAVGAAWRTGSGDELYSGG